MLAHLTPSEYRAYLPSGALLAFLDRDNATWPDSDRYELVAPSTLRPLARIRQGNPTESR